ncbi:MAG TPA: pilus assembly PilX N-terminal domain-containing protein [Actinomycetota bacterium]|nr:pilus assembly PilX N-terminal domain-containing protein [Actinomycetota bacterium]
MRRVAGERGVAMITVLLIGAVLTVVSTSAGFMAVRNLRATTSDGQGSKAVAYAEAGLERFLNDLRSSGFGLANVMAAGCTGPAVSLPAGIVGDGSYNAELTVYNPAANPPVPPSPWVASNASLPVCQGRSTSSSVPQLYAVTATGTAGTASRAIRSVVRIAGSKLPVGVWVNSIDANGNPDFANISVFSRSDILGRTKLAFTGTDRYYTMYDVYPFPGQSTTVKIPAAAHSAGSIYTTQNSRKGVEHPPNPNCTANPRGTAGQSLWDGSSTGGTVTAGCAGQSGYPPTSRFTLDDFYRIAGRSTMPQLTDAENAALKAMAQGSGIYCSMPVSGSPACTKNGATWNWGGGTITGGPGSGDLLGLPANWVAYFEYPVNTNPLAQDIKWNASTGTCEQGMSGVIVVRNGGVTLRGGGQVNGNVVAPEGVVDSAGGFTVTGSVIAREMRLRGTARFELTDCYVQNIPAPLMSVSAGRWSEVDR